MDFKIIHKVDASAAKGIMVRVGAGKVKHLSVRQLGIQEAIEKLNITCIKIPREENVSDLLARANTHGEMVKHLEGMSFGLPGRRSF